MLDGSRQLNIPTVLPRDLIDSDVNDLTNSMRVLNRKNCNCNALAYGPDLTRLVADRRRGCIITLTLSSDSRNAGHSKNHSYDQSHLGLHLVSPRQRTCASQILRTVLRCCEQ